MVCQHFDARGGDDLVLEDLVAGEAAARHQMHLARDAVHLEGGLQGRVAAADDGDVEAPEERPVAGRAVDHAAAGELPLAGDAQMALLHTAGDDEGARGHLAPRLELQDLAAPVDAHAHRLLADELFDAVPRGLGEELLHQVRAGDELVAGVVGDVAGRAELAADVHGHDDRAEVLARRVHGGGEAGGPAPHDGDVIELLEFDRLPAEPPVEFAGGESRARSS